MVFLLSHFAVIPAKFMYAAHESWIGKQLTNVRDMQIEGWSSDQAWPEPVWKRSLQERLRDRLSRTLLERIIGVRTRLEPKSVKKSRRSEGCNFTTQKSLPRPDSKISGVSDQSRGLRNLLMHLTRMVWKASFLAGYEQASLSSRRAPEYFEQSNPFYKLRCSISCAESSIGPSDRL
nr:hypothetical protein CFP56_78950 [Quercus suber]